MNLDVRTTMVLFAMLSIIISGLILLAGHRTRSSNSIKQWSIASLCIGLGLGSAYFFSTVTPSAKLAVMVGSALVTSGVALQFTGIQSFKLSLIYKGLAISYVAVAILLTYWFEFIQIDISARSIANSLMLSIGCAACASLLLRKTKPPLKAVLWFTGLSFALLSVVMLIRAIVIADSLEVYSLYSNIPINPITFVISCILQVCIAFGFLLMSNHQLIEEIEKSASMDTLTGAFNRRQLEHEIVRLQSRFERTGDKFSLMLVDVDNFKFINDNYGHPNGDEVLRRLTNIAIATIRVEDYFARYGGDEFCILLPSTSTEEALIIANRLREAYASTIFEFRGEAMKSSISIGITDSSKIGLESRTLIGAADHALYKAKQSGRNKVVFYSASASV